MELPPSASLELSADNGLGTECTLVATSALGHSCDIQTSSSKISDFLPYLWNFSLRSGTHAHLQSWVSTFRNPTSSFSVLWLYRLLICTSRSPSKHHDVHFSFTLSSGQTISVAAALWLFHSYLFCIANWLQTLLRLSLCNLFKALLSHFV